MAGPASPTGPRRARATIKDVAARAGVHPSTVSRALDPVQRERISDDTRRRVEDAVRELDYQADQFAVALRRQRTFTIGVLVPDFSNPVYASLLQGVNERLEGTGYTAILVETQESGERFAEAARVLADRRVDGLLSAATRAGDAAVLGEVLGRGIPGAMALRWVRGVECPVVTLDDHLGGHLAAQHLVDLGHRDLWQLRGPQDIEIFHVRASGFGETVRAADGQVRTTVVGAPTTASAREVMAAMLAAADQPPTAVFAHSDVMAIGVTAALSEAGLRCPQDVSVVGYNDIPLVEHLAPPLTTVRIPARELGRLAAEVVLDQVQQTSGAVRDPLHLRPSLVERGSTAPPRSA